jgi:hypothetical protein
MRTRPALFAAALLASGIDVAVAQSPPVATQPPPPGAWGQAAADITGTVRMFKLTPVGELEGFILSDGTEVHFPPHLTEQLAAVRPDDRVEVRGWQSARPGFVVGTSVTDARTGQTVVDQGPPPPGTRPPPPPPGEPAPGAQWASVQGQVRQDLHGPAGDINGALLADGTELKLPPPAAYQVSGWLQPGETIAARGYLLANRFGRVMDVQAIGPSPDRLAQVGWVGPPGPGGAPPAPPGPGPAAAPPGPGGPSQR